jgi:hypothetical protein
VDDIYRIISGHPSSTAKGFQVCFQLSFFLFSRRVIPIHTIFAHTEIEKIGATMCEPDFFCSCCFLAPAQKEQLQKKN